MLSHFCLRLTAACFTFFGAYQSLASDACSKLFEGSLATHGNQLSFPTIESFDLPSSTKTAILNAKSARELRAKFGEGEGLAFSFPLYGSWREIGEVMPGAKGEWTQTQFAARVLSVIFPKSLITRSRDSNQLIRRHPDKKAVHFEVWDSAEFSHLNDRVNLINMPLLKSANSTGAALSKTMARSMFRFSQSHRAASLYIVAGLERPLAHHAENVPDFLSVSEKLFDAGFRSIFLTFTLSGPLPAKETLFRNFPNTQQVFEKVIFLSEISIGDLPFDPTKKILIVNDLTGVTPIIHAASSLAYVQGPINFFEPLIQETPTLIFNNSITLGSYNRSAYDDLLARGLGTNRATSISDFSQLNAGMWDLQSRSHQPFIRPDLVAVDGTNALERLLSRIEKLINDSH